MARVVEVFKDGTGFAFQVNGVEAETKRSGFVRRWTAHRAADRAHPTIRKHIDTDMTPPRVTIAERG